MVRPKYYCSCSSISVSVDGFTNLSTFTDIDQNHGLERFATVSVDLSVHTGNCHPVSSMNDLHTHTLAATFKVRAVCRSVCGGLLVQIPS